MNFEPDELLTALKDTAQRVAQDHVAARGPSHGASAASDAGFSAAQRAGLLELLDDAGESAAGPGEDSVGPMALGVVLDTLARSDTGLALYVWAQNVARAAASGADADLAERIGQGLRVGVPLDLELSDDGWWVACAAELGLHGEGEGWCLAAGEAGPRTSVGIDGADIGRRVSGPSSTAVSAPDLALAVASLGCIAAGVAARAVRVAATYARERQQFGHPIGDFQAIQFMLADARTGAEGAQLITLAACSRGELPASARALMAAASAARVAADVAVQVHGGAGYTRDYPAEALLRDSALLVQVARRRFEACALDPARTLGVVDHV